MVNAAGAPALALVHVLSAGALAPALVLAFHRLFALAFAHVREDLVSGARAPACGQVLALVALSFLLLVQQTRASACPLSVPSRLERKARMVWSCSWTWTCCCNFGFLFPLLNGGGVLGLLVLPSLLLRLTFPASALGLLQAHRALSATHRHSCSFQRHKTNDVDLASGPNLVSPMACNRMHVSFFPKQAGLWGSYFLDGNWSA
jgi:hypothetical protein